MGPRPGSAFRQEGLSPRVTTSEILFSWRPVHYEVHTSPLSPARKERICSAPFLLLAAVFCRSSSLLGRYRIISSFLFSHPLGRRWPHLSPNPLALVLFPPSFTEPSLASLTPRLIGAWTLLFPVAPLTSGTRFVLSCPVSPLLRPDRSSLNTRISFRGPSCRGTPPQSRLTSSAEPLSSRVVFHPRLKKTTPIFLGIKWCRLSFLPQRRSWSFALL